MIRMVVEKTVRANKMKTLAAVTLLSLMISPFGAGLAGGGFVLKPNFTIEGGSYRETLVFISGLAYAISQYERDLAGQHLESSYCLKGEPVTSKLLVDLLNETLSGTVTPELATDSLFQQLSRRFPCS